MTCSENPGITTSACRHCRHYAPEGRRGGHCQQLNVAVRGSWKACSLSLPPFAPSWEKIDLERMWSVELMLLSETGVLNEVHANRVALAPQDFSSVGSNFDKEIAS